MDECRSLLLSPSRDKPPCLSLSPENSDNVVEPRRESRETTARRPLDTHSKTTELFAGVNYRSVAMASRVELSRTIALIATLRGLQRVLQRYCDCLKAKPCRCRADLIGSAAPYGDANKADLIRSALRRGSGGARQP
jgi:hypothetical protein